MAERRYSPKREAIRTVLINEHGALSATAIQAALPHLDPATIYRNLERFVADGSVKRLSLGGETVYEHQTEPHHHAVCGDCGRIVHFSAPDQQIAALLSIPNFTAHTLEITVHGACAKHQKQST